MKGDIRVESERLGLFFFLSGRLTKEKKEEPNKLTIMKEKN